MSTGGSITKRVNKNGSIRWVLKYDLPREAGEKRKTKYEIFNGKEGAAKKRLREILNEIEDGRHVEKQGITVAEWAEKWLAIHEVKGRISVRTIEGYSDWLRIHVLPALGKIKLQKLTSSDIDDLYIELLQTGHKGSKRREEKDQVRGLSARSVLHIHRVLNSMIKAAERRGLVSRNVVALVDAPSPSKITQQADREEGEEVTVFTVEECRALLLAFADRTKRHVRDGEQNYVYKSKLVLVTLALATGCRRSELLALRWSDLVLDGDERTVQVAGSIDQTRRNGIRAKNGAKNKSSIRRLEIDPATASILQRHSADQKALALAFGMRSYPNDCLVFPTVRKRPRNGRIIVDNDLDFSRPTDPRSVTKDFARVMKSIGLKGRSFHSLRHTHATDLLADSVPVHVVANRLGHKDANITLKTYAHWIKRGADQAALSAANLMKGVLGI